MANKKSPGFLLGSPSSKNKQGLKNRSPADTRSEALQSFQRRFREINPLLIKAMNRHGKRSPKDTLANLVKFHQESLIRTAKTLGYTNADSMPELDRFLLSKAISDAILECESLKGFKTSVAKATALIRKSLDDKEQSGFFNESQDEVFLSSEAISNLKINALRPTLDFSRTLSSLGIQGKILENALEQQVSIATSMAKDICFNHDSDATLWDREKLFISLIEPCMDSVSDSWLSLYGSQGNAEIIPLNKYAISELLIETKKAIDEDDMGHAEQFSETLEEIGDAVLQMIEIPRSSSIPRNARFSYIHSQIIDLDHQISLSWRSAVTEIQNEVSRLSEEDLENWIQNEGSEPMSLSKLWRFFDAKAVNVSLSANNMVNIDDGELAGQSFFRLIQSWGLTDTLCKVKG